MPVANEGSWNNGTNTLNLIVKKIGVHHALFLKSNIAGRLSLKVPKNFESYQTK